MIRAEVIDIADRHGVAVHAARSHELDSGRVHCRIPAGTRSDNQVYDAVLAALGKDVNNAPMRWRVNQRRERLLAWAIGEGIETLYVSGIEHLGSNCRIDLLELAETIGSHLWLIANRPSTRRAWSALRVDWDVCLVEPEEFLDAHPLGRNRDQPATPLERLHALPVESYISFRHAAKADLSTSDFRLVDSIWQDAHAKTAVWLAANPEPHADDDAAASFLCDLTTGAPNHDHAVIAIRGAQAATLATGHYELALDEARFASYARFATTDDLERGGAAMLRRYLNSDQATAALVRLLSHASVEDIRALNVGDVAPDGTWIEVAGHRHVVPDIALGIVRAQLSHRHIAAAKNDDSLIATDRGDGSYQRPSTRGISSWLRAATFETGLVLKTHHEARSSETAQDWLRRRGFLFRRLA